MTNTIEPDKRSSADTIYYGKVFHPYGKDWVEIGLRDFVPLELIVKVIIKNIPDSKLPANWESLSKEKIVSILMQIYNKASPAGKQRIEKWVFAHRYRRKVQHDYPFLKRLEEFYMFLREGKGGYRIPVPPDVATKVAAQLTLSGIDSLPEVKSILKSTICKNQEQWQVFDSLFNVWFKTTIESYSGSPTIIRPSAYLHFENDSSLSVEEALKKLRGIIRTSGSDISLQSIGGTHEEDNTIPEEETEPEPEPDYPELPEPEYEEPDEEPEEPEKDEKDNEEPEETEEPLSKDELKEIAKDEAQDILSDNDGKMKKSKLKKDVKNNMKDNGDIEDIDDETADEAIDEAIDELEKEGDIKTDDKDNVTSSDHDEESDESEGDDKSDKSSSDSDKENSKNDSESDEEGEEGDKSESDSESDSENDSENESKEEEGSDKPDKGEQQEEGEEEEEGEDREESEQEQQEQQQQEEQEEKEPKNKKLPSLNNVKNAIVDILKLGDRTEDEIEDNIKSYLGY